MMNRLAPLRFGQNSLPNSTPPNGNASNDDPWGNERFSRAQALAARTERAASEPRPQAPATAPAGDPTLTAITQFVAQLLGDLKGDDPTSLSKSFNPKTLQVQASTANGLVRQEWRNSSPGVTVILRASPNGTQQRLQIYQPTFQTKPTVTWVDGDQPPALLSVTNLTNDEYKTAYKPAHKTIAQMLDALVKWANTLTSPPEQS